MLNYCCCTWSLQGVLCIWFGIVFLFIYTHTRTHTHIRMRGQSVGLIWWKMKYYTESKKKGPSYMQYNEERLTWLINSCIRSCLLKHVIEGRIEGSIEQTRSRGRGPKPKKNYFNLKQEALDRISRGTGCGRGYGPVARKTVRWMN